ncbi:MAG: hypothetical protein FJ098_17165, partial [Deltaproteobacteria bacterium]|nr:hypothetical protein [Deltaproteobacteria bacterium]
MPRSIEAFLGRALEKEPSARFQSAAAFAAALRRAVEDHDASPETVSLPPLTTTDQGLRLITQAWTGAEVTGGTDEGANSEEARSGEAGARGTAILEAGAFGADGHAEAPPPSAPEPESTPPAVPETPPSELGGAETAWAVTTPERRHHAPSPPAPEPESPPSAVPAVPEPDEADEERSDSTDRGSPDGGEGTLALAFRRRFHFGWLGGGAAVAALLVTALLWAPWRDGPGDDPAADSPAPVEALAASPAVPEDVPADRDLSSDATVPDAVSEPADAAAPEPAAAADATRTELLPDLRAELPSPASPIPQGAPAEILPDTAPAVPDVAVPPDEREEVACAPSCRGRSCGDDGCGDSCGECGSNRACVQGACVCRPACKGRSCGLDGCGGSCGSCESGKECDDGQCIPVCVPLCGGKNCGPDGCGGSCGRCGSGETCRQGSCAAGWEPLVQQGKEAMDRGEHDKAADLFRKAGSLGAPAAAMDALIRK